jgi:hypothetical protein
MLYITTAAPLHLDSSDNNSPYVILINEESGSNGSPADGDDALSDSNDEPRSPLLASGDANSANNNRLSQSEVYSNADRISSSVSFVFLSAQLLLTYSVLK